MAVTTIRTDGDHAAMFFLLMPDGRVQPELFLPGARPVGEQRKRELANAVASSDAEAVAFVSEAWATRREDVPVVDARETRDLLLVAAIDRSGETAVFETPIPRDEGGEVEPGESREYGSEYQVALFDGVREAWGLSEKAKPVSLASRREALRRDLGFGVSAEVPYDWRVQQADKMIELFPPSEKAAAHISIFRRRTPEPAKPGDASSFIERFPAWRDAHSRVGPTERQEGLEVVATGSCVDNERNVRWQIGARVGSSDALVFSYNDDGSQDDLLRAARMIFASIRR